MGTRDITEQLRDAQCGFRGDDDAIDPEVAEAGAKEIERLREALRIIQAGIPGPRLFAAEVLAGDYQLRPLNTSGVSPDTR